MRIFLLLGLALAALAEFKFTIETTNNNENFEVPLHEGTDAFTVNWGDGSTTEAGLAYPSVHIHTFAVPGTYQITIDGAMGFRRFGFNNGPYAAKLLSVESWGNVELAAGAFFGCVELTTLPADGYTLVGSAENLFHACHKLEHDFSNWDVSACTDMHQMFMRCSKLAMTGVVLDWDISQVSRISGMFHSCFYFDAELNSWDTSHITDLSWTFYNTYSFNRDLDLWDVSNVNSFLATFATSSFNGDISTWDTSSATDLSGMFSSATEFNQDISQFDVSNVQSFWVFAAGATSFNADISGWNTGSATSMKESFLGAHSFIADLRGWDVSNVGDASYFCDKCLIPDFDSSAGFNCNGETSATTVLRNPLGGGQSCVCPDGEIEDPLDGGPLNGIDCAVDDDCLGSEPYNLMRDYEDGEHVHYESVRYVAQWDNNGEEPGTSAAWQQVAYCQDYEDEDDEDPCADVPTFSGSQAYTAGDRIKWGSSSTPLAIYEADAFIQGHNPLLTRAWRIQELCDIPDYLPEACHDVVPYLQTQTYTPGQEVYYQDASRGIVLSRFKCLQTSVGQVPGHGQHWQMMHTCEPEPPVGCEGVQEWSPTQSYLNGVKVVRNGDLYLSNWYTTNVDPETNSNPYNAWTRQGTCGSSSGAMIGGLIGASVLVVGGVAAVVNRRRSKKDLAESLNNIAQGETEMASVAV